MPPSATMADAAAPDPSRASADDREASSTAGEDPVASLDSALLESIFYNEMLLLDDPSHSFDMGTILGESGAAGNLAMGDVASVGDSTHTTHTTADVSTSTVVVGGGGDSAGAFATSPSAGPQPPPSAPVKTESAAPLSLAEATAAAPPALAPTTAAETAQQLAAHAAAMASALPPPPPPPAPPQQREAPQASVLPIAVSQPPPLAAAPAAADQPTAPPVAAPRAPAPMTTGPSAVVLAARLAASSTPAAPAPAALAPPATVTSAGPTTTTTLSPPPQAPLPPRPTVSSSITISGGGLPALAVQAAAVAARAGASGPARPRGPAPAPKAARRTSHPAPKRRASQSAAAGTAYGSSAATLNGVVTQPATVTIAPTVAPQPATLKIAPTVAPQPIAAAGPVPTAAAAGSTTAVATPVVSPLAAPAPVTIPQMAPQAPQAALAAPVASVPVAPAAAAASVSAPAATAASPAVQEQKATQMVSQFAALASHLGISLPPNVLQSLTTAAQQKMQTKSAGGESASTVAGDGALPTAAASAATVAVAVGAAAMVGSQTAPPSVAAQPVTLSSAPAVTTTAPGTPVAATPALPAAPTAPSAVPPAAPHPPPPPAAMPSSTAPLSTPAVAPLAAAVEPPAGTPTGPVPGMPHPSTNRFVRQLQETAEAAIAAVEDHRKWDHRKRSASADGDVDGLPPLHKSRPGVYKRKKKPRLEDCEVRLARLRKENETLKRHLSNVTNQTQRFDSERQRSEVHMREVVKKCSAAAAAGDSSGKGESRKNGGKAKTREQEEELKSTLTKFSEMYSDYGKRRQEELQFHLEQLERLAVPTTFTKMTLWTMGQGDQFFLRPKSNPIAGILMKELGITPQQGRKIIEHRDRIKQVCANIQQCLVLLARLKSLCEHKNKLFMDRMNKCQETLSPLQVVKLLLWVDEHSGTLENVCPGWGSERIRTSPATGKEADKAVMESGTARNVSASRIASVSGSGENAERSAPTATPKPQVGLGVGSKLPPPAPTSVAEQAVPEEKGKVEAVAVGTLPVAESLVSAAIAGAPGATATDEGSTSSETSAH